MSLRDRFRKEKHKERDMWSSGAGSSATYPCYAILWRWWDFLHHSSPTVNHPATCPDDLCPLHPGYLLSISSVQSQRSIARTARSSPSKPLQTHGEEMRRAMGRETDGADRDMQADRAGGNCVGGWPVGRERDRLCLLDMSILREECWQLLSHWHSWPYSMSTTAVPNTSSRWWRQHVLGEPFALDVKEGKVTFWILSAGLSS